MSVAALEPPAAPAPERRPWSSPASETPRLALLGNPNTGKTTLFNHLCGLRAKTANFPGTTTDARIGRTAVGADRAAGRGSGVSVEVVDLPGTYRIHLELPEARICRDVLQGEGLYRQPDAVVVVVDATNLARNLYLVGELLASRLPTVVALNMVDIARRRGLSLDAGRLAERLGCPVVPMVARRGTGVEKLRREIDRALHEPPPPAIDREPLPDVRDFAALAAWADRVVEGSVGGKAPLRHADTGELGEHDEMVAEPPCPAAAKGKARAFHQR